MVFYAIDRALGSEHQKMRSVDDVIPLEVVRVNPVVLLKDYTTSTEVVVEKI